MASKTDDRPLHIKTQQILRSFDSMSDINRSVVQLAQIIKDYCHIRDLSIDLKDIVLPNEVESLTDIKSEYIRSNIANVNQFVWRTAGRMQSLLERTILALMQENSHYAKYCVFVKKNGS